MLIEQNLAAALAKRIHIINNGHIVHEGPAQEFERQPELLQRYLGIQGVCPYIRDVCFRLARAEPNIREETL